MTIITPTGITGITSITSTGNTLQFQNASGADVSVSGLNVTSGTNINVSGIITASGGFSGNINSTGVSTVTTLRATSVVGVNTLGVTTAYIAQLAGVGAGTSIQIPSGSKLVGLSAGSVIYPGAILQVVHTQLTTAFSGTSTQTGTGFYIDVTGLSATITPTSTTSKILILTNMYIGKTTSGTGGYQQHFRIKRNGTAVILGAGEGGRPTSTGRINMYDAGATWGQYQMTMFSGVHYDSPSSTSALTYQIALGGYTASPIVYVNRSETWQVLSNDYDSTPVSTLTLMEVAV